MRAWFKSLFRKPVTCDGVMQAFSQPCKITRYGYKTDNWKDSNSAKAIGCYDNELDEHSMAVSPDVHLAFLAAGIRLGNMVKIYFSPTETLTRRWDDLTANDKEVAEINRRAGREVLHPLRGRLDLYCPHDELKSYDGRKVIGFKKVIS